MELKVDTDQLFFDRHYQINIFYMYKRIVYIMVLTLT